MLSMLISKTVIAEPLDKIFTFQICSEVSDPSLFCFKLNPAMYMWLNSETAGDTLRLSFSIRRN